MTVTWSVEAVVGALTGPLCSLAGAGIYFARPDARQNRLLALILVMEGLMMAAGGGWMNMLHDPPTVYALQAMTVYAGLVALPCYLLFLGTLEGPVARVLRARPLRATFATAALVGPLAMLLAPHVFLGPVVPGTYGPLSVELRVGFRLMALGWMLIAIVGLATVITAWRASTGPARARGRRMTAAFLWRDAMLLVAIGLFTAKAPVPPGITGVLMPSVMLLGFVLLLGYAIVRDQVLGIELAVKSGLRRGFVVAPFTIAIFVVAELLEDAVPFDSTLAGIAAAGVIALFVAPIQRGAARLADRLMPHVEDTPDYRRRRAEEIFDAALATARADGALTDKDRRVLAALARHLGLEPERADERLARTEDAGATAT